MSKVICKENQQNSGFSSTGVETSQIKKEKPYPTINLSFEVEINLIEDQFTEEVEDIIFQIRNHISNTLIRKID